MLSSRRAKPGSAGEWILRAGDDPGCSLATTSGFAFSKLGIKEAPEDNRRVLAVLTYLRR